MLLAADTKIVDVDASFGGWNSGKYGRTAAAKS